MINFKDWLEKFALDNKVDLYKIYDGLELYDKALLEAKSELNLELNSQKELNANLQKTLNEIKSEFGLKTNDLKTELVSILETKNKNNEVDLNGLKEKINTLEKEIQTEKQAKNEAIRKNKLKSLIDGISDINKEHLEIIEIKLNNAFKIDDSGAGYFEKDGQPVEPNTYLNEFFKANEKYKKPVGSVGNGVKTEFIKGISDKKFSDMSLTEKAVLYKTNKNEYERLKALDNE